MRLRIVHKLFIALVLIASVSLIVLGGMTHWSLGRGFLHYVNQIEKDRFEKIAEALGEEYRTHGSWDVLKNDPSRFLKIIRTTIRPDDGPQWRPQRHPSDAGTAPDDRPAQGRFPRHPRRTLERVAERMTLYDASRQPLFGNRLPEHAQSMLAIDIGGETVGWLGYRHLRKLAAGPDVDFLRQQLEMLVFSMVAMAGLAGVLAVLLARQLSKPITAITQSIKRLASGQYNARLIPTSSDELGRLAADVNQLAATLQENESTRRRWIADVSHELRTPIAVLRGEVEAVQDGIRDNDGNFVHSVAIEVTRLSKLVDDLYQLSMSDVGALNYRFEPCSISSVLEESIAAFKVRLDECGVSVESAIEADIVCNADRQRMAQLFANLIENTCRYTQSPGKLRIKLAAGRETISIDLADSGPGVSADEAGQLFDPLYRGEHSRSREHGGAGLGLSICRKIVEAHRGAISAQPSDLGGVAIHIELPVTV